MKSCEKCKEQKRTAGFLLRIINGLFLTVLGVWSIIIAGMAFSVMTGGKIRFTYDVWVVLFAGAATTTYVLFLGAYEQYKKAEEADND